MVNRFDDEPLQFCVLVNGQGHHSLWPEFAPVPASWRVASRGTRRECLDYVAANWHPELQQND